MTEIKKTLNNEELAKALKRLEQAIEKTEQNLALSLKSLQEQKQTENQTPDEDNSHQAKKIIETIDEIGQGLNSAMDEIRSILRE